MTACIHQSQPGKGKTTTMMKRLIISIIGATLLIAPMAQAQQQRPAQQPHQKQSQQNKVQQQVKKNQFKKGGKLSSPGKHSEFKDYRKQGLRAPGKGQRWVRVEGQYLLIAVATGAILSVASGN